LNRKRPLSNDIDFRLLFVYAAFSGRRNGKQASRLTG
jgi:hypothetical protein